MTTGSTSGDKQRRRRKPCQDTAPKQKHDRSLRVPPEVTDRKQQHDRRRVNDFEQMIELNICHHQPAFARSKNAACPS